MFRDKLKSDLNKLTPSEQVKAAVLESIEEKPKAKIFNLKFASVIAACLAVVLLLTTFTDRINFDFFSNDCVKDPAHYTDKQKCEKIVESINQYAGEFYYLYEKGNSSYISGNSYYDTNSSSSIKSTIKAAYSTYKAVVSNESKKPEFSETNTQVSNVDEDDIAKTDGKHIFRLRSKNRIIIYKADGENTINVSSIIIEDGKFKSFYLSNNKLIAISKVQRQVELNECDCETCNEEENKTFTRVSIYDVENVEKPKLEKTFDQSGSYENSRMVDDVLYLTSLSYPRYIEYRQVKIEEEKRYLPLFYDDNDLEIQDINSVYLSNDMSRNNYTLLCSYDTTNFKRIDDVSIFGRAEMGYVSLNNIYCAESVYKNGNRMTDITRFSLNKGIIKKSANELINGYIINQFSMDEKDGYLRLVSETSNASQLCILDMDLKLVSKIGQIAKGENLKSVRFIDDYVYFVTFKNVDPLFCADISDPKNPKILSKLKIPGFSEYLHPYGEGKLLGFGYETNKRGWEIGLKLSMFDISNPKAVTEQMKRYVGCDYSEVFDNHKAILVSKEKNLICFSAENYD
ncbi:MAG: beta-propeller domain-containing protein, partial [Clostridia bacterium]|nr:beta-propeller domain-containing protein [Clostridia bacterium]